MIPITDEEAQNWPLEETGYQCSECERYTSTVCGFCGHQLCEELACIKTHAARGCYTNLRYAHRSQAPLNQHPAPDARPQHDPQDASSEPTLDGEVAEEPSIPERG